MDRSVRKKSNPSLKNIHNIISSSNIPCILCYVNNLSHLSASVCCGGGSTQRNPLSAISLLLLLSPSYSLSTRNASMFGSVCCVFVVVLYVCSTNNYAEDDGAAIMIMLNIMMKLLLYLCEVNFSFIFIFTVTVKISSVTLLHESFYDSYRFPWSVPCNIEHPLGRSNANFSTGFTWVT